MSKHRTELVSGRLRGLWFTRCSCGWEGKQIPDRPTAEKQEMEHLPFKVEVIADSSNTWAGNLLRFPTWEEAEEYGTDLAGRWMAVRKARWVNTLTGQANVFFGD